MCGDREGNDIRSCQTGCGLSFLICSRVSKRARVGCCFTGDKRNGNSPGSFLVRNDALVIIDFDTVTTLVAGVKATEMPIGPSLGWPDGAEGKHEKRRKGSSCEVNSPEGLACREFLMAFVTNITSGNSS